MHVSDSSSNHGHADQHRRAALADTLDYTGLTVTNSRDCWPPASEASQEQHPGSPTAVAWTSVAGVFTTATAGSLWLCAFGHRRHQPRKQTPATLSAARRCSRPRPTTTLLAGTIKKGPVSLGNIRGKALAQPISRCRTRRPWAAIRRAWMPASAQRLGASGAVARSTTWTPRRATVLP